MCAFSQLMLGYSPQLLAYSVPTVNTSHNVVTSSSGCSHGKTTSMESSLGRLTPSWTHSVIPVCAAPTRFPVRRAGGGFGQHLLLCWSCVARLLKSRSTWPRSGWRSVSTLVERSGTAASGRARGAPLVLSLKDECDAPPGF